MEPDRKKKAIESDSRPYLPDPIILDILSRLPGIQLARLKCVCKGWRHTLSDPHFLRRRRVAVYESRKPPSSVAFRCVDPETTTHSDDQPVISFSDNFKYLCPNARVWNSCDGLILFSISDKTFFAFNPCTGDRQLVRRIPPLSPVEDRRGSSLLLGLGFDTLVNEYKVVGAVVYCQSRCDDSFGFCSSLESSCNYSFVNKYFPYTVSKDSPGTNVNGVLYWMVNRNFQGERVIVYFDFAAEGFVEMTQPTYESDVSEYDLGVLRWSLCVVCHRESQVEVLGLDMRGDIEAWVRLFVVSKGGGLVFRTLKIWDLTDKGEVIMAIDRKRLVVYNLEDGTHRLLYCHPVVEERWRGELVVNPDGFEVVVYVESLVCPRSVSKGYGAIVDHSSTGKLGAS